MLILLEIKPVFYVPINISFYLQVILVLFIIFCNKDHFLYLNTTSITVIYRERFKEQLSTCWIYLTTELYI